jgi:chemotaxis protein CheD
MKNAAPDASPTERIPMGLRHSHTGCALVKIDPGGYFVSDHAEHVLFTVLGSCVSACVRDPMAGIGGMNHFMLPTSVDGDWDGLPASLRYGNFAMERLINDLLKGGGRRGRLEAKLFGGGTMTAGSLIGARNAEFVKTYLRAEGIAIVAADLRGDHARRVHYAAVSGRAFMLSLPRDDSSVAWEESSYAAVLDTEPVAGSIEIF